MIIDQKNVREVPIDRWYEGSDNRPRVWVTWRAGPHAAGQRLRCDQTAPSTLSAASSTPSPSYFHSPQRYDACSRTPPPPIWPQGQWVGQPRTPRSALQVALAALRHTRIASRDTREIPRGSGAEGRVARTGLETPQEHSGYGRYQ